MVYAWTLTCLSHITVAARPAAETGGTKTNSMSIDNDYFARVQQSFDKQGMMKTLHAQLVSAELGQVKISCPFSGDLTQQHGFFHAGVATSIADSACGYAALTMMPEEMEVLSVEYKINFLRPAKTDKLIAVGQVLKPGKTLTICEASVYDSQEEMLIAKMTATMIAIQPPVY